MRVCVTTCLLVLVGTMLAVPALPSDTTTATPTADCPCLTNGGQPGPGACVCDVERCFSRCVSEECPGTPNCMLDCTFRCGCQANESLPLCLTHVDPGPTPTPLAPTRTSTPTRTSPRGSDSDSCSIRVSNTQAAPLPAMLFLALLALLARNTRPKD
jgi:hypothetical protein